MNNLLNILKKEFKEIFRDKKSLMMMLLTPLLIPLVILGMSYLFDDKADPSIEDYNKIGFNYTLSDPEKEIAKSLEIDYFEGTTEEVLKKFDEKDLNIYVTKKENTYTINGISSDTNTNLSVVLLQAFFEEYNTYLQNNYLIMHDINPEEMNLINIEENLKEEENFFINYITSYGFIFIIMTITTAATYPATDTTAGEKERGTLETLLTFPIKSRSIIIGKFLSVSFSSFLTGLLGLILLDVSLLYANDTFTIYKDQTLALSFGTIMYSVISILLYSLLISGICIAIASKSKSFKEAQSALGPISLVAVFPSMIAFLTEMKIDTVTSLIPFLNISLIFDSVVKGTVNPLYVLLMTLSTLLLIAIMLFVIIKQYKSEKVLF